MGRFESPELRREALAHESLTARQGLAGKCWCLACTFIVAVGLYSVFGGSSSGARWDGGVIPSLASAPSDIAPRSGPTPSPASPVVTPSPGPLPEFSLDDDDAEFRPKREELKHLGTDFSLMGILLTVLALLCVRPLLNACSSPWSSSPWNQGAGGYNPWLASGMGGQNPDLLYAPSGAQGTLLGSNYARDGRIVDVKPGELRGGGGFFGTGWLDQGAGMDWTRGVPGAGGAWSPFGGQGVAPVSGGSWNSQVPSPYSMGGLNGAVPGAGGWPGLGYNQSLGLGGAHGQGMGIANLPSEAEVTESYVSFGSELQQWVPRLTNILDKQIIEPLLQELDDSDRMWQQALQQRNWRLTAEAPRQTYPGMGPPIQEVSVFDRFLPQELLQINPMASDLWSRRQKLESYLIHPTFGPEQRQYVLQRLREWRDRGLANAMRADYRQHDMLPTDAHILENLLVKMLNITMEFDKCFLATQQAPPLGKHLGQSPVAYLRQVTDQTVTPKSPPHYEVLTLTKVWKLRPGNRNLIEALALLMHMLRRHHSRSFQSFPTSLRNAVEPNSIANLPARIFPSLFSSWG